jgi:hypothetical protein
MIDTNKWQKASLNERAKLLYKVTKFARLSDNELAIFVEAFLQQINNERHSTN